MKSSREWPTICGSRTDVIAYDRRDMMAQNQVCRANVGYSISYSADQPAQTKTHLEMRVWFDTVFDSPLIPTTRKVEVHLTRISIISNLYV
jgi:hypothetical protein